ncbi:putative ADP-ribosylation factor GTPase-activating protein AGD14 isoform X1 [Senna tora]|uniref:Putative ADP-ribosylation factor GTPase-activating protein AGD14 isoform X1 n=1 Tax=Senna tora TaxID=362788 RepID=A0A834SFM1_9FABA|nr:putative ADP-ribosylation factor GTPase-activating protein AGD14 isoform X1 [Senna tora]
MGSRKEDERNEKIIRGLMKLPPNRRCINCNSLGPQYVCTNFWTFVCMTCSGIHREFTHRVKSVSMAKFTSQEVEALQNGGNQRARDIYLKDWDFQRQRLPDSRCNICPKNYHKIDKYTCEYVDLEQTNFVLDMAPGAMAHCALRCARHSPRIHGDETRRASSYHSFSQSPPYDYQYEDRRYGKQAGALTRKPGSDKGRYEGNMASIIYSPGRFSDHASEDRFANEGSGPRISDYSVTSGGEQFKSGVQSPKFHNIGVSSPFHQRSSAGSSEDVWSQSRYMSLEAIAKGEADGRHPQTSFGTTLGSTASNSVPFRSYSSGGLVDLFSEPMQASGPHQDKVCAIPQQSHPPRSVSLDLSKALVASEPFSSSVQSIDLFALPASSQAPSVDLFQASVSSAPSLNDNQSSQTSQPSSIDLFVHVPQQQLAVTSDEKSPELFLPKNEGWATFDMPQQTAPTAQPETPAGVPSTDKSLLEIFDPFSTANVSLQWPSFEPSVVHEPSTTPNPWHGGVPNGEQIMDLDKPWNAFEDSGSHLPIDAGFIEETQPNKTNQKSTNPFDLPYESDVQQDNMVCHWLLTFVLIGFSILAALILPSRIYYLAFPFLYTEEQNRLEPDNEVIMFFSFLYLTCPLYPLQFLDISSLQAALPDAQLAPPFHGGIAEPWLPQSMAPYISSTGQGKKLSLEKMHPYKTMRMSLVSQVGRRIREAFPDDD